MIITYVQNKKPIKEEAIVAYKEHKAGEPNDFGGFVRGDHIDCVWDRVERFPANQKLYKTVLAFGGSGARKLKYFIAVGDLMCYISNEYSDLRIPGGWDILGRILTGLAQGNHKRVIVNSTGVTVE